MRLIDADKLIKEMKEIEADCGYPVGMDFTVFLDMVKEQPTVDECDIHCGVHDALKEMIERLQERNTQYIETIQELKAKALSGWIPCSLGLEPEEDGLYLCTLDGELVGEDKPFVCSNDFYQGVWADSECMIAWQPLPEPYEEGE